MPPALNHHHQYGLEGGSSPQQLLLLFDSGEWLFLLEKNSVEVGSFGGGGVPLPGGAKWSMKDIGRECSLKERNSWPSSCPKAFNSADLTAVLKEVA